MESASGESLHVRLRSIREASGVTQLGFLDLLNREARIRGARSYSQSTLSKLESGAQAATFIDVAIFASVDPLHRGKLWLAWGESEDATLRTARPPVLERLEADNERVAKAAPAKEVARKSGRAK